nr:hypothetical protein [uncultured Gellertiella sp.]
MSGLETAIKKALDRSERSNAEVRARIYQSARQALEAGLRKQNVADPAVVADQRHKLEMAIGQIEHDERRKQGVVEIDPLAGLADAHLPDEMAALDGETREEQTEIGAGLGALRAERLGEGMSETFHRDHAPEIRAGMASGRPAGRRSGRTGRPGRRGGITRLFVSVMVLAFVAMAGWWAYTSGLFLTPAERDTSVANPPAAVSEEDVPEDRSLPPQTVNSANSFSSDWIEIFRPGDADRVQPGSLATARLTTTGDGQVVRITSGSSAPEAAVRLLLPQDSVALAGEHQATLAISLRSASDATVDVTVDCEFGGAATCERHRFTVTSQRTDALVQLLPATARQGGAPALVINSDVEGKGRGVDLIAVRLLPVP